MSRFFSTMKTRSRKTYFLKRNNDELRSKGLPLLPRRLCSLLLELEDDSQPFNNAHAAFLVNFMDTLEARQGRMVKQFDILLARKTILKLMKGYNHFVLLCDELEGRINETEKNK